MSMQTFINDKSNRIFWYSDQIRYTILIGGVSDQLGYRTIGGGVRNGDFLISSGCTHKTPKTCNNSEKYFKCSPQTSKKVDNIYN